MLDKLLEPRLPKLAWNFVENNLIKGYFLA